MTKEKIKIKALVFIMKLTEILNLWNANQVPPGKEKDKNHRTLIF